MNKFKHTKTINSELSATVLIKRCLTFSLLFSLIATTLLLVSSAAFMSLDDPTHWSNLIGKVVLYVSAIITSFFLSKKNGQGYIFSGIVLGAIITSIIFLISLIYPDSISNSILWILLIPVSTILGSVLGIKRQGKLKMHRHHK